MAGWDKIRAAAQRPDCIFSAFPDGTAGAMYHPRGAADESLTPKNNACINNGAFTKLGAGKTSFFASKFDINGIAHDLTILAKFYVDVPAGTSTCRFAAVMFGDSGSGGGPGIHGLRGTYEYDGKNFPMNASVTYNYIKSDGTAGTANPSLGWTPLPCRTWHTMAMSIDVEKKTSGYRCLRFFINGELKKTERPDQTWWRDVNAAASLKTWGNGVHISETNDTADAGSVWQVAWGLIFNRALSDEEIKYLSED